MISINSEKYSGDVISPNRDDERIPVSEKRKKMYCKSFAEFMYSQYVKGKTYVGSELYSQVHELRKYAYGKQDEEKYKDTYLGKKETIANFPIGGNAIERRRAYANIDFSIMSPMPRIIDALIGKLSKATDIISIDAIDSWSGAEKESMKWGLYVDGKYRQMFESLRTIAGLPQEDIGYVPRNVDELELYEAEGGFKQNYVVAMEELVKYVLDESRWDEELLTDFLFDLITVGFAASEDVYNDVTGEVLVKYCDPEYTGVQYTRESQYDKPDWGFTISFEKLSTMRQKLPDVDEVELQGLAKRFDGQLGNPHIENWNTASINEVRNYAYQYDDFVVPVFKARWIDVEYDQYVEYTSKYGHKTTFEYTGQKLGKKDIRKSIRKKMLYECSWVIDTDHCFDYGVARFQGRDGLSEPILPIRMVKVKGRPIVPRVIPALDMFQNSWLKLQQGISMATANGLAINLDSVNNLNLGGGKLKPLEAIKIWRQTGILFYKGTNVVGQSNMNMRVVDQISGGAGTMIQDALSGLQTAVGLIEQMTGINPVTLGSTPDPNQGKAVTQFAIEGTNDVLKNIVAKCNVLKSDISRNVCLRLNCVISNDETAWNKYKDVIGETRLELIKIAEGHDVRYGIRTHVRPTDQEMNDIYGAIELSLKNGRDGKVGISEADAIRFRAMVYSGASLKRVAQLLAFAKKQAEDEAEARAMRAQEMNTQLGMQSQQAKAQQDAQAMQMEIQMKDALLRNQTIYAMIGKAYELKDKSFDSAMALLMPQQPPQQMPEQQMSAEQV